MKIAILGGGRWARVVGEDMERCGHKIINLSGTRKESGDSWCSYRHRWTQNIRSTNADIAWIAIPPGDQIPQLCEACLNAGCHTVIEKPWVYPSDVTGHLERVAQRLNLKVGVNYQYLFLNDIMKASKTPLSLPATAASVELIFTTSKPERRDISPFYNLGSHLFAIKKWAFDELGVSAMNFRCGQADERAVRILDQSGTCIRHIDFTHASEPLLQRFIDEFIRCSHTREPFISDLTFAHEVNNAMINEQVETRS